jgi:L-fucose dehydrogenase
MDLDLRDRVVLISGGAKGIGAAIVRAVAGEKGTPVVLDRDAAAGESLVAELRQSGHRALFVPAELTSSESCAQAVERVVRELGALHALVNNAGVNDRVGLEDGSPERYRASLERNLFHFYDLAHHALPHLRRVQAGAIVNIASKAAVTGQGGTSGYASAKGAILALTREWAVELLPYGIRVNAIVPAEVMTPLYESWLATFSNPDEKLNAIVAKIPLGKRMTKPEEIAATAVFLLSSKSAGHITGQHLFVDGGYVHLDRALG